MSLDYPNREDWLVVRNTRPRPGKYIHLASEGALNIGATGRKGRAWARKEHNKRLRRKLKREAVRA